MSRANSGVELLLERSLPAPVGGGVMVPPGVAVSPWKDSNGVCDAVGVAVSPWNDWNGVPLGGALEHEPPLHVAELRVLGSEAQRT